LLQAQDELKLASKMLEYKPSVWPGLTPLHDREALLGDGLGGLTVDCGCGDLLEYLATEADIEAVEREIDAGLVEELLLQAQDELKLASRRGPTVLLEVPRRVPPTWCARQKRGQVSCRGEGGGICTRTRQRPEGGQAEATN
jgi:hypothetical protein